MNDQNETTQLRYLEETATRLRQNGFTVEPIEDHHLPVCWEKGRLCRISGKGSVLYRQERVDVPGAQDALQAVIDTAKMTSEYMAILETAPRLKASGLDGDYRILADFGDAVLAGHPTERGVQFVTWDWDYDREGVHHGHYFQENYDAAKRDFIVRGGLVQKDALFEPEQLAEIYANYDMEKNHPCDTLELCLCKGDSTEESWSYQLNAAEREVLTRKMEAFCQQQTGMSLRDYAQQFREEPEQRQGPVMKL